MARFHTKKITRLGVTIAEFIRRTGISPHTLKKMDLKDPSVKETTWAKADRELSKLEAEIQLSSAAAG